MISIHAPTRGATTCSTSVASTPFFQSTLLQEERPQTVGYFHLSILSIHAPTRGATKQRWLKLFGGYLSIHAPTRGATFPPNASLTFSSLSIHAPTRGATLQGRQF